MKRFSLGVSLVALLFSGAARADWSAGSATDNLKTLQDTVYTYTFTTAADSTGQDLSACDTLTATFDQSTGDSSTDAAVELRACPASSSSWQACTVLRKGPGELRDGVATSIGSMPEAKPFLLIHVLTAPTGGDTGRVQVTCRVDTTTTSGAVTPGGSDTQVQFNSSGSLGGSANLTWDGNALKTVGSLRGFQIDPVAGSGSWIITGVSDPAATSYVSLDHITATDYLVGEAATQTLTNKSISAASNTITVPAANSITANSLTISGTELGYLDGVTSNIQTQIEAKANTADILSTSSVVRTDADSTVADGSKIDMSAVNQSDTNEGLVLPQHATNCANATSSGMSCYDTTYKQLFIGDGTRAVPVTRDNIEFSAWLNPTPASTVNGKWLRHKELITSVSTEGSTAGLANAAVMLGASKAFVERLTCMILPAAGTWDAGADDFTFTVREYDASHTGGTDVGTGASTPSSMTVQSVPDTEDIITSDIFAWTTYTGGGRYIALKASGTDANTSVTLTVVNCSLTLYRAI